jgi:GNAT superfamily N-acetyltransferase
MAIEIKPVSGGEQLERWVAVHNEIRPDDPEDASMKALIRAEESEHVDLLAYLDGKPVGTAMLSGDAESEASGRPWIEVDVLPAYRGRGVGGALLAAASEHARRRGQIGFSCETRADDAYSLSFLERRGFVENRRWNQFVLELDADENTGPAPPDGVDLTSIADRPELLARMYEVAASTFPELGGHFARHAESFVKWQVYELGSPATPLDLAPLAIVNGTVVGFATMRTLFDNTVGELRMVTVLPEWRCRGIASALLATQAAGARRTGIRRLTAWVPDDGPAALYRKLGFEQAASYIVFEGPLHS